MAADVGHADGRSAILEVVTNQTDDPLTSVIHGAASAVELQPWHQLDPDALTAHFHVHVASSIAITGSVHNQVGVERCVIFDSYSASTPRVGWSAYSILKAAAEMAFRAAAEELEEVAIARVYPGAVKTPLLARVLDAPRSIEATAVYHDLHDTGRVSTAEEIAEQLLPIFDLSPAEIRAQDIWPIGYPA